MFSSFTKISKWKTVLNLSNCGVFASWLSIRSFLPDICARQWVLSWEKRVSFFVHHPGCTHTQTHWVSAQLMTHMLLRHTVIHQFSLLTEKYCPTSSSPCALLIHVVHLMTHDLSHAPTGIKNTLNKSTGPGSSHLNDGFSELKGKRQMFSIVTTLSSFTTESACCFFSLGRTLKWRNGSWLISMSHWSVNSSRKAVFGLTHWRYGLTLQQS